ncbi:MAG: DNA mismatch repair protein MutS [Winogradskyella sp.]|uniref:MutS-related protein n=1 Tax=Winogradskyella sp. TaxID=1883156 RepID=UPI0017E41CD1|nr:DNA mismatch repair protein MutS [Winogradskyella sp.]MBT8243660.1 DNA mismatch repair protein MutS [Winogradskyella sp.]NNK23396.1 DNA mismatch repair protein MutS [Winogradskyella sp.]
MQNPSEFYKTQLLAYQSKSKKLFKTLSLYSLLRLGIFVVTVTGIYFTFSQWQTALGIGVVGVALFLVLLSKYIDLKAERSQYKRLVKINEEELKIAFGDFYDRGDGSKYQNPKHFYSLDIDLFGIGSFFQFVNRTTIKEGTQKLVDNLLANDILGISERQNAIRELSEKPEWRQNYSAIAQGVEVEDTAVSIIKWLKDYKPFLSKTWFFVTVGFSFFSALILGLAITEIIPISYLGYWLLIGLALTASCLKGINNVAQHSSKAKETFRQYAQLLNAIENIEFSSKLLKTQQNRIQLDGKKASDIFSKFSKHIDALDNRNNLISAVLGNGYFLWDIRQTYYIEQWIQTYSNKVEDWFGVVTFFDAYNSFGNYAFNHQEFSYPKITEEKHTIFAQDLGHPLLNANKRVASDLKLQQEQFFIVTGANMAGKSTFLRTVALQIVMANVGLPVCAKESRYKPIKLITSMRTTDSLTDDSSYFFSELTRLKFIVDTIAEDNNYFIILDEILKGTNSTDKAIGSRKFVEKLVKLNATGIIATHDLSLTEIESELEPVKNYFFDAQIVNDELYFDYKLKQGVCQNMNASFLLKKMQIV